MLLCLKKENKLKTKQRREKKKKSTLIEMLLLKVGVVNLIQGRLFFWKYGA